MGGLVCAAYLAVTGDRILVLEQHDVVGGSGHTFRRRRAYQFDVGVHYQGDCGPDGILPAILGGLGLRDRVRFLAMDQDGFDRIMMPGLTVDVPAGWARYRDRLIAALPKDAAGITAFTGICEEIAVTARRNLLSRAPKPQAPAVRPESHRWSRYSLAELFDPCGLSTVARTMLAAQSGNYGAAPEDVCVATHPSVMDHHLRGAFYPAGGGQVVIASLVEVIEAYGGEVRTRCAATRIIVEGGAATGVEIADGSRLSAAGRGLQCRLPPDDPRAVRPGQRLAPRARRAGPRVNDAAAARRALPRSGHRAARYPERQHLVAGHQRHRAQLREAAGGRLRGTAVRLHIVRLGQGGRRRLGRARQATPTWR